MKILCIGEALIDMICTDRSVSLSDGQHFLKKAGGAPANVAAAIAALGGQVDMAAKVGKDPFGKHIVGLLQEMGVSTKWIIEDAAHFTSFAFVSLMEAGERDFYFNRGADGALSIADLANLDLKEYGIVHFGSATAFLPGPLQATYLAVLASAKKAGVLISFDPNYRHLLFQNKIESFIHQAEYFIAQCDFYKLSDEEALFITGAKNIEEAANILSKKSNAVFAITMGKEGTLLVINNHIERIESIPIQPIDATGAGDAFVGAMLFQLKANNPSSLQNLSIDDWKKMVANANKAGARTCEYLGAMEAFKHLNKSIFS